MTWIALSDADGHHFAPQGLDRHPDDAPLIGPREDLPAAWIPYPQAVRARGCDQALVSERMAHERLAVTREAEHLLAGVARLMNIDSSDGFSRPALGAIGRG